MEIAEDNEPEHVEEKKGKLENGIEDLEDEGTIENGTEDLDDEGRLEGITEIEEDSAAGEQDTAVDVEQLISPYKPAESDIDLTIYSSSKNCIFRIPVILYRHNPAAYRPIEFPFGPFFPPNANRVALKIKYLRDLVQRFGPNARARLLELENAVHGVMYWVHACYDRKIDTSESELKNMLLLDGCFILELFLKYSAVVSVHQDDPIFGMASLLQVLSHDLILLENQIPWRVLEAIYDVTKLSTDQPDLELHQLVIEFFRTIFSHDGFPIPKGLIAGSKIKHILDLLREGLFLSYLDNERSEESSPSRLWGMINYFTQPKTSIEEIEELESGQRIPSASRLREAGVKFKKVKNRGILDITFHKGVLEIPSLSIHDNTEVIFRNLIAFEQCCHNLPHVFTSYAKLMDDLIDTVDDLHILSKNGIISNSLNPQDATNFFNRLYNDTRITAFYYDHIYKKVNGYCRKWWPRWRAFYIHNYFGKPWAIVSQVFALIILTLTILQLVLR